MGECIKTISCKKRTNSEVKKHPLEIIVSQDLESDNIFEIFLNFTNFEPNYSYKEKSVDKIICNKHVLVYQGEIFSFMLIKFLVPRGVGCLTVVTRSYAAALYNNFNSKYEFYNIFFESAR